ncbi:MAG: ribulose bisphosphate carboxylase small subunit [Rhodospirillales bacterium]|nr:ribulose bisphosphate carboxylase small subunit [Rhodospirillales bacterium]
MYVTQGQFSFLPPLTDAQIVKQVEYAHKNGWAVNVEFTDDPHPRNTYWEMMGQPLFDQKDAAGVMTILDECRKTYPRHYIRVTAFDSTRGWEAPRMSFIVQRPKNEPGFGVVRQEADGRTIRYTTHSYATDRPEGERYND